MTEQEKVTLLERKAAAVEKVREYKEGKHLKKRDPLTTMKKIVYLCLINGILWVWSSYILAFLEKTSVVETLSQVALTEIIAVVLVYAIKSVIENLSKYNDWPDKSKPAEASKEDSGPFEMDWGAYGDGSDASEV